MNRVNFIHIPKNAGMTIRHCPELKSRILLSTPDRHISPEYTKSLLMTMNKYHEHHGYEHARWRDLREDVQANQSFAIVRNPWSKVISRYTFLMNHFSPDHPKYQTMMDHPTYEAKSFEEFSSQIYIIFRSLCVKFYTFVFRFDC